MDKRQCNSNLQIKDAQSIDMKDLSSSLEEIRSLPNGCFICKPLLITQDLVNKTNVKCTRTNKDIFNETANNKMEFMRAKKFKESPVSLDLDDINMKQEFPVTDEYKINNNKLLTDINLKGKKFNNPLSSNQNKFKQRMHNEISIINTMKVLNRNNKNYSNLIQMYCVECKKVTINYIDRKCQNCQTLLLFQCVICDGLYKRLITIQNHLKYECHKESIFYCNECSFESKYKLHLITHIQNEHSLSVSQKKFYMCSICQRKFSNQHHMLSHARVCTNELILRCKYCSFKTKLSYILIKHVELKHKTGERKNYQCSDCGKKFEYRKYLNRHVRRSCDRKFKFDCDHCNYITDRKYFLVKHIQKNHPELFIKNKFLFNL